MLGRTDSRRRMLVVLAVFAILAASLLSRLAWWQVVQHDQLAAAARAQISIHYEQPSRRGTIYDRSGTVVLATSVDRYRLAATPADLTPQRRAMVAESLVDLLGLAGADATTLTDRMNSDRAYVILTRDLDEATAARIRTGTANGSLPGIALEPEPFRVYPLAGGAPGTTLAAKVLGFVNRDGEGQYGIEQHYQGTLAGEPRVVLAERDASNNLVPDTSQVLQPGVTGQDLRLTIDAGLQLSLEQELMAAGVADRAPSVSAVVMDPYTGEVYAEATYPSYDANDYRAVAARDPAAFVDPVVSSVFEPGSVFKMFTALAGFEKNVVTTSTPIRDTGSLALDGGRITIYDSDKRAMGWLPFQDVIAFSRNVGAARVAMSLAGSTRNASAILAGTWEKVGFGRPTGIDLAGEVPGILRDPAVQPWHQVDLANAAFGQGVAVTPIQLATAYSALVNGGRLVQPHVVLAVGSQAEASPESSQVISSDMSKELTDLMYHVVHKVPWYRDKTLVPGYTVGGKTGTAQIWDPKLRGGRGAWKRTYNHTFVGWIGKKNPRLIIAVTIREAKPLAMRQGFLPLAVESYELFRRIATDAVTTLDLSAPVVPRDRAPSSAASPRPSQPSTAYP
jgi:cell division protein FtsI/penicillin-binding protein 2